MITLLDKLPYPDFLGTHKKKSKYFFRFASFLK